jgi:hypothetical protein
MTTPVSAEHPDAGDIRFERPPFLSSQRAAAACARQLTHLAECVVDEVQAMASACGAEAPVVRRSPGRCIVQVGPVAITITWLHRNTAAVEDGELLTIIWRGSVAPREEHHPERVSAQARSTATAIWEESRRPVAASEETWAWHRANAAREGGSPSALAAAWTERLRAAYERAILTHAPAATPAPTGAPKARRTA